MDMHEFFEWFDDDIDPYSYHRRELSDDEILYRDDFYERQQDVIIELRKY